MPPAPSPSPPQPGMAFGPPPSVHAPGRTNPLAKAALLTGLLGMNVIAVGLGIAALVQIRRTAARGRGMAIGGIVAGATWLVALLVVLAMVTSNIAGTSSGSVVSKLFPKPGQCFDIIGDGTFPVKKCDRPHDAEMIVAFDLPEGDWPGEQEVIRVGDGGCEQRLRARYRTSMPVADGDIYVLHPRRLGWSVGDRQVLCAIIAAEGRKLTRPIAPGPSPLRLMDELQPGDCFTRLGRDSDSARVTTCDAPHNAQLTHRFELPQGPYPGDSAIEEKAQPGCDARWRRMFSKHPSPVRIEEWYIAPVKESWALGDRLVLCYVTGAKGRDLTRSVVPD